MYKTVRDLSRHQLTELKQQYAAQLAECGDDVEVMGISYKELSEAEMIPDDVIFEHYEDVCFTDDDFIQE